MDPADCISAYQAIGADSYAASLVKSANSGTYDLTEVSGTVTWDAINGWTFANDANHFATGILKTSVDNTWTYIIYIKDAADDFSRMIGIEIDTTWTQFAILRVGGDFWFYNENLAVVAADSNPHILCLASDDYYVDGGAKKGTIANIVWGGSAYTNVFLGGNGSGANGSANVKVAAAAIYNRKLVQAEVQEITTKMLAL